MATATQKLAATPIPRQDSALYLNDFVSLPIIITDFDAEHPPQTPPQQPGSSASSTTSSPMDHNWSTGFSDFADEVWRSMTSTMRTKLREAAVEVLKRTDDKPDVGLWENWDDDARFLD